MDSPVIGHGQKDVTVVDMRHLADLNQIATPVVVCNCPRRRLHADWFNLNIRTSCPLHSKLGPAPNSIKVTVKALNDLQGEEPYWAAYLMLGLLMKNEGYCAEAADAIMHYRACATLSAAMLHISESIVNNMARGASDMRGNCVASYFRSVKKLQLKAMESVAVRMRVGAADILFTDPSRWPVLSRKEDGEAKLPVALVEMFDGVYGLAKAPVECLEDAAQELVLESGWTLAKHAPINRDKIQRPKTASDNPVINRIESLSPSDDDSDF